VLCTQFCVDCTLPKCAGGVDGAAIFVDAEGSFDSLVAVRMAGALARHCRREGRQNTVPASFDAEHVLRNILVVRTMDALDLDAAVRNFVTDEIRQRAHNYAANTRNESKDIRPIRLVVLDGMASAFRSMEGSYRRRTEILVGLSNYLKDLAACHNVAVVVCNHLTSMVRPVASSENGCELVKVPALGCVWAHSSTTRIMLNRPGRIYSKIFYRPVVALRSHSNVTDLQESDLCLPEVRTCTLEKSIHRPPGMAHFVITDVGVRDVPVIKEKY